MKREFKPYPKYRDSGIDWIGKIPAGWTTCRIGSIFRQTKRTGFPEDQLLSVYRDYGVIQKNSRDDNHNKASEDLSGYQLVNEGDLVINKMKAWQGSVAISGFRGIVSPAYHVAAPNSDFSRRFTHYLLRTPAYIAQYGRLSKGVRVGQWDLPFESFRELALLLPPASEAEIIARFLDEETAKIDAAIKELQDSMELLEQEKYSLISQTVTHGLHKTRKMRKPGVEWVTEIPNHWSIVSLRHYLLAITSGSRGWAEYYSDDGPLFVRIGNLSRGTLRLKLDDIQRVTPPAGAEGERTRIQLDDVLFSITAYLGSVAVASPEVVDAYINQHIALVRLDKLRVNPRFLGYFALSHAGQTQLNGSSYGGTKVQLSLDDVRSFQFCLPPLDEQESIAAFLDAETERALAIVAEKRSLIAALQEYRASLIYEAVTGKIDVCAD